MTNMRFATTTTKAMAAVAVIGALAAGQAHATYEPFYFDDSGYTTSTLLHSSTKNGTYTTSSSGNPDPNPLQAGELSGTYHEKLSTTPTAISGSVVSGTFNTSAYFQLGSFADTNGNSESSNLSVNSTSGAFQIPGSTGWYKSQTTGYKIFALFNAGGTYTYNTATGAEQFLGGSSGGISFYVTKDLGASAGFSGQSATITSATPLIELAYSNTPNTTLNSGKSTPGGSNYGDFSIEYDQFHLTTAGKGFFNLAADFSDTSFFPVVVVKGQFNENPLNPLDANGHPIPGGVIDGSANAHFSMVATSNGGAFIPEPSTVALVGLSIFAAGAASRRRKN